MGDEILGRRPKVKEERQMKKEEKGGERRKTVTMGKIKERRKI